MYYFIASPLDVNEVARKSGIPRSRLRLLYEESLTKGMLCIFKVEATYPPEICGLIETEKEPA